MKKKSIVMLATGIVLTASLVIGGTLAFFTDHSTANNVFTVGAGVDIKLDEANVTKDTDNKWTAGSTRTEEGVTYEGVYPGAILPKDPTITNEGDMAVYARMKVKVDNASAWQAAVAAHNDFEDLTDLFTGLDTTKWELADTITGDDNSVTYVYNYLTQVGTEAPNNSTGALFTAVTIPGSISQSEISAIGGEAGFQITVTGEAIQAVGFDTPNAAFEAIDQALADNAVTPEP